MSIVAGRGAGVNTEMLREIQNTLYPLYSVPVVIVVIVIVIFALYKYVVSGRSNQNLSMAVFLSVLYLFGAIPLLFGDSLIRFLVAT